MAKQQHTPPSISEPIQSPMPQMIEGYLPRRVDIKLPQLHAEILRDKLRQLQDTGARLKDGTMVSDRTKAMLWIFENEVITRVK